MTEISLTIPMDASALRRAGQMLTAMADDLKPENKQLKAYVEGVGGVADELVEGGFAIGPDYESINVKVELIDSKLELAEPENLIHIRATETGEGSNVGAKLDFKTPVAVEPKELIDQGLLTKPNCNVKPASEVFGVEPAVVEGDLIIAPEFDAMGMPWDERIHAKSRLKVKRTNAWKLQRNIDKEYVAGIEAETKLRLLVEAAPLEILTPPLDPRAINPLTPPISHNALMLKITSRQKDDPPYINVVLGLIKEMNLSSMHELLGQPEKTTEFDNRLEQLWQG